MGSLHNRRRVFIWYEVLIKSNLVITCNLTVPGSLISCNTNHAMLALPVSLLTHRFQIQEHIYCSVSKIILL